MKRKLFSAILFGALLTASTSGLTSCKDYDDDISNLQSQIDKLATADQLSAKVSEMQAAIAAAKTEATSVAQQAKDAAEQAKTAAAAAATKADVDAAKADAIKAANDAVAEASKAAQDAIAPLVTAIEKAQTAEDVQKAIDAALAGILAEVKEHHDAIAALETRVKAVEDKLKAIEAGGGESGSLAEIQAEINAIDKELVALIGEYTTMVTDVDLYVSDAGLNNYRNGLTDGILSFVFVPQEKDTKFPAAAGVANEQITFSSDNKNVTTTDSLVVRVSPTNAVLNPENISLINSQGKELSEFVTVKSVKPYNKLITTRSASEGNGLWNVVFEVKPGVDREKLAEAVAVTRGNYVYPIEFAVAVKNTASADNRRVISAYEVNVSPEDYEPARRDILVDNRDGVWKSINNIRNRFLIEDDKCYAYSRDNYEAKKEGVTEYAWENAPQVEGTASGKVIDESDVRCFNQLIDVAVGQDINISVATLLKNGQPSYGSYWNDNVNGEVGDGNGPDWGPALGSAVKGFYVTLDKEFAIESSPSEWNAWVDSYTYTNVGVPGDAKRPATMFYGNNGYISIDSEKALGDIIGFRVYVVNLDGTLVDPDGRAFYVRVAKDKETAPLAATAFETKLRAVETYNTYAGHFGSGAQFMSDYLALTEGVLSGTDKNSVYSAIGIVNEDGSRNYGKWICEVNPSAYGNNAIVPVYGEDYVINWFKSFNWPSWAGGEQVYTVKDAKFAQVQILNPQKFLDDETYKFRTTLFASNGTEVRDITIEIKKVMPTAEDIAPLAWVEGYDPTKQVFANSEWANANIWKYNFGNEPKAVRLWDLMTNLAYGTGSDYANPRQSWYQLEVANVQWAGPSMVEKIPADLADLPGEDYQASGNSDYKLYVLANDIDNKSHDISYKYDFGAISLQFNYQTAQYNKPEKYVVNADKKLAMTFNSWIDFEDVAWKEKAPSVRYLPGTAWMSQPIQIGTYTTTTRSEVEEQNVVKVGDKTYNVFHFTTTRDVTTNVYRDITVTYDASGKELRDTTYYEVNVNGETATATTTKFNVAAGAPYKEYYQPTTYKKTVSANTEVKAKYPLVAWNTEISNYTSLGAKTSQFGSKDNKVEFASLLGENQYIYGGPSWDPYQEFEVSFSPASLFNVSWDPSTKSINFQQKTYTVNPQAEGTLTITGRDCFGHAKTWTVKVNIEK